VNPFDDRRLWIPGSEDELAEMQPPTIALSQHDLDRIARLALHLTQAELRRNGAAARLNRAPGALVPYEERPEEQRAASRTTIVRILQALTMLGYIDVS